MSIGRVTSLEDISFVPTQDIPISKIKFDEKNPNVLSGEKNAALSHTVKKYGFAVDPWLNDTGDGYYLVIDGEHRIKLLIENGVTSVKCKIFKVSYVDVQMLRQVANKLRGQHDKTKDADEFKAIFENDKLNEFAKMLGEPIESFQDILRNKFDMTFGKEEQEIPEPPEEPKSKLGDIYQLGNHKVMCGDSTDEKSISRLLVDSKVDLLLTDPPYGVDYASKNEYTSKFTKPNRIGTAIINDNIKNYPVFFNGFLKIIPFSDYNTIYIFMGDTELASLLESLTKLDFYITTYLIWNKHRLVFGRKDYHAQHEIIVYGWKNRHKFYGPKNRTTVLNYEKRNVNDLHPTMKPVEILCQLITDGSKKEMLVYDPFLGSGSTLIAAEQTNRVCYGMELDPAYVDVIIQRWENFTGKKAKKINK